jgi:anti-sigma factor RsiW
MVDLTCQEMVELVTLYLEGSLTPQDKTRFEEHLGFCKGCSNYFTQMRHTIRSIGRLSPRSLSFDMRTRLVHDFRDWSAQSAVPSSSVQSTSDSDHPTGDLQ